MLENIPFGIQVEIFKRLPVKTLIQFRSVSKEWKSLIDNSDFIARYSFQQTEPQNLILLEEGISYQRYISIADDDTFPEQRVVLTRPQFPTLTFPTLYEDYRNIGCSHGLLCIFGHHQEGRGRGGNDGQSGMAVIWNLSIRKAVAVIVPNVSKHVYGTTLGFGVCRETMDPKIVKITNIDMSSDMTSTSCIPWQVEVFTLSMGAWRRLYCNLYRKSIEFGWQQVDIDGFLYWLATYKTTVNGGDRIYSLIISFDMKAEEFSEINLPNSLAEHNQRRKHTNHILHISKLKNSLVVLDHDLDENNPVYAAWRMEHGVSKSFTKLYTLNVNIKLGHIVGFRKSGVPIVELLLDDVNAQLVVYEPNSKHADTFRVDRDCNNFLYSYMETLLLLDQPELMVYDDISM